MKTFDFDKTEYDIQPGREGLGVQEKFWITIDGKEYLVKIYQDLKDRTRGTLLCELAASEFLKAAQIESSIYEPCEVIYHSEKYLALISESFLKENEELIFTRPSITGINNMGISGDNFSSQVSYFQFAIKSLQKKYQFSHEAVLNYFIKRLTVDYILGNGDSEFHNIGLIVDTESGQVRFAPYIDMGQSYSLLKRENTESIPDIYASMLSSRIFESAPHKPIIDDAFERILRHKAKKVCEEIQSSINRNIGGIDNLKIPDRMKYNIKRRIDSLLDYEKPA